MLNVANRMGRRYPPSLSNHPPPPATSDEPLLRAALKRSASALKADGVPFALGGGYALWVHGGPEPSHDVDLVVAEADVEVAANSLAAAGLQVERPPEDWLFKAYLDGGRLNCTAEEPALVDVLHRLGGVPVTESLLDTSAGTRGPGHPDTGAAADSDHDRQAAVVLRALLRFRQPLLVVRAVREQLDWAEIRKAVRNEPFAEAFLFLVERLGIIAPF